MMKKLKYKRILASILLLVTMLSVAQPIFAASGTGEWVGGQYASYIKTTDNADTEIKGNKKARQKGPFQRRDR